MDSVQWGPGGRDLHTGFRTVGSWGEGSYWIPYSGMLGGGIMDETWLPEDRKDMFPTGVFCRGGAIDGNRRGHDHGEEDHGVLKQALVQHPLLHGMVAKDFSQTQKTLLLLRCHEEQEHREEGPRNFLVPADSTIRRLDARHVRQKGPHVVAQFQLLRSRGGRHGENLILRIRPVRGRSRPKCGKLKN